MPPLQRHANTADASVVILGAGLAGLSLADALLARGVTSPIVLLDARPDFSDDRTWCFWDVHPHPYRRLVAHRWTDWAFARGDVRYRLRSAAMPYCHLPASRFYDDVLSRVRAAPNCTLNMGVTIDAATEEPEGVRVLTSAGEFVAAYGFDALGTAGPTWTADAHEGRTDALSQRFLGQFVETRRPAFDPSCVTLMDFEVTPNGALRFMYVLPFNATSALVEDTTIGLHGMTPDVSRTEIARYLRVRHELDDFTVIREEHAVLPMVTPRASPKESVRIIPVGTAAGAVRPSSGYAFVRTQRQVAQLAMAFASGGPSPAPAGRRRDSQLDTVFLKALRKDPEAFADYFMDLGRRMSGDRLARFMMDAATPLDIAAMIAALPKRPFIRAAGRTVRDGALC